MDKYDKVLKYYDSKYRDELYELCRENYKPKEFYLDRLFERLEFEFDGMPYNGPKWTGVW